MKELRIFEFEGQKLRAIVENGEVMFMLEDICNILGLSPAEALKALDPEQVHQIDLGLPSQFKN